MPDHLHVLLKGANASSAFLPFMKLMRQRTAIFYRRLTGESLWQEGCFDRVLRPDDAPAAVARYMMENPVRAGLVSKPEDYPFSYGQASVTGMLTPTKLPAQTPEIGPFVEDAQRRLY
jgi:REP element-mobilizing transposase RayT